jgi:LacI family transcriptional regulator
MADTLAGIDITTIDQPEPHKAGARMVAMLQALVDGTPAAQLQELWQPLLLPGSTVGACPL